MSEGTEDTAQEQGPEVSVERTSPCECTIRIEADADYLQERYQEELSSVQETVALPGFRQGKAPIGLVEKRLGARVRSDVIATMVSEGYAEAVEGNDLNVVSETEAPDLEEVDWQPGEPAEFEFRCEVMPEVEIHEDQYKDLEVEVPALEVTEEMLQSQLEQFAGRFATWEEASGAGIDWDDYVEATVGVPEADWSDSVGFRPRQEQVGPFAVEGVKGALIGAEAGDEIELTGKAEEDRLSEWPDLDIEPGRSTDLHLTIESVMRREVPEVDEELAEKIGMDSADEIISMVKERLQQAVEERTEEITEEMLKRALLERLDLQVPPALAERASRDQQARQLVRMLRQGIPREEAERQAAENADRTREAVEEELKISLLLREIAEQERILVTESEVDSQIRAFASRQGWRPEKARSYLEEEGFVRQLRHDMRESKVLDFLLDNATVREVSTEEFSEKYGGEVPAD